MVNDGAAPGPRARTCELINSVTAKIYGVTDGIGVRRRWNVRRFIGAPPSGARDTRRHLTHHMTSLPCPVTSSREFRQIQTFFFSASRNGHFGAAARTTGCQVAFTLNIDHPILRTPILFRLARGLLKVIIT